MFRSLEYALEIGSGTKTLVESGWATAVNNASSMDFGNAKDAWSNLLVISLPTRSSTSKY